MIVDVRGHLEKLNEEFTKNEHHIINNPELPIKTLIELYEKQVKLEKVIGWINNIDAFHNPKKVIPLS